MPSECYNGQYSQGHINLSYPKTDKSSMNAQIPREECTVQYLDFDQAVKMCLDPPSDQIYAGKSDMSMAFRNIPLKIVDFKFLVLKAEHQETGNVWYFVDKCLPFGSSISCKIFQEISNSIAFLVSLRMKRPTLNYLDDYFFVEMLKRLCDWQVQQFLNVCDEINFPVSLEKTHWGSQLLVFLGFLLDLINKRVGIPLEKIEKALSMIEEFLNAKKTTVHRVQKLCGTLNFLCRAIIPGRAFTRRLYAMTASNGRRAIILKPHHHVRIKQENKLDLKVWKSFLQNSQIFCRPFVEFGMLQIEEIRMYSDASGNYRSGGFSAWCEKSWLQANWDASFVLKTRSSIEYLELFAVTAVVLAWAGRYKDRRMVRLFCDNQSVCHMLNTSSSSCKYCMVLIRLIVLTDS